MSRAIVSVAIGESRHIQNAMRLALALRGQPTGPTLLSWVGTLPPLSPSHQDMPYAFKPYAIKAAYDEMGYSTLLWMDSSVVPLAVLDPLWEEIESKGYWFSANSPHTCGEWTSDAALAPLEITREEAFEIPQVIATSFGLDFSHKIARTFINEWGRLASETDAFRGPWTNTGGEASKDVRVRGHRHDQIAASVIAHRLGMTLSKPPKWIVDDGMEPTDETYLEIRR